MFLDRIATRAKERWAFFFLVLGFFVLRIYIKQGYAVIAYLLGLFYLNNVMLYLAPAEDPEETQFSELELPTRENDEYKGF